MKTMHRTLLAGLVISSVTLVLAVPGDQISLEDVFKDWEPTQWQVADYHSMGVLAPGSSSPTMRAISFSTGQKFDDLWNYYAGKCGIERRFTEGNSYVLSGTNTLGSFLLVERIANANVSESVFGLRTEG